MNDENLIPLNKRTKDEQRKIQSAGGVASGASRRAYKSLRQAAKVIFQGKRQRRYECGASPVRRSAGNEEKSYASGRQCKTSSVKVI